MRNLVNFVLFVIYTTCIFFLPNNFVILFPIAINIVLMLTQFKKVKKILINTFHILPFVIFTFVINIILDNLTNATWVGIKLIVVCNATFIYSSTTTILEVANTIKHLCAPLKIIKINTDEIKIMVCISLSMIPILKAELNEIKSSCKAKNIAFNVKNMKFILSKFFLSLIKRVNQIEEALIAKGYNY